MNVANQLVTNGVPTAGTRDPYIQHESLYYYGTAGYGESYGTNDDVKLLNELSQHCNTMVYIDHDLFQASPEAVDVYFRDYHACH